MNKTRPIVCQSIGTMPYPTKLFKDLQRKMDDNVIKSLMYVIECTWFDLAFILGLMSQSQSDPGLLHWTDNKEYWGILWNQWFALSTRWHMECKLQHPCIFLQYRWHGLNLGFDISWHKCKTKHSVLTKHEVNSKLQQHKNTYFIQGLEVAPHAT